MKEKLLLLAVIGLLASCRKDALNTTQTDNPNFQVEFLFEKDGIKVYRFYDGGVHYFTKNSCTSIKSCGKNCTYEETIETK